MKQLFEKYLRLIKGYIKSIGEKKEDHLVKEDAAIYKGKVSGLDNLLSNYLLTNDQ